MLQSVVRHVKLTANAIVAKAIGQGAIAAAFIIAAGFAVATLTVWLVQTLGPVAGCAIMAGVFAFIGIIAAAFVSVQDRRNKAKLRESKANRAALMSTLAAANPLAVASTFKAFGRRSPVAILLLVVAGVLLGRSVAGSSSSEHTNSDARPREREEPRAYS